MDKRKFLFISVLATLIPAAGRAQAPAVTVQQSPAPGLAVVRIIDECNGANCTTIPRPEMKTIQLPIPGYKQEDAENYFYHVANVRERGSGGSTAFPDDDGFLSTQGPVSPSVPGPASFGGETQYYFTTTHADTGETRVTLDLYQVHLWPFVNSLQMALQARRSIAERRQALQRFGPNRGELMEKYLDVRLNISGEHMTVDEILDAVYLDTGCIVDHDAGALFIASCP